MTPLFLILSALCVLILIIASALCSASEASVLATSRVRLHHFAQQGNERAQTILDLQTRMGSFISSILLANTWCITIVTALATGIMTTMFGAAGAVYAGIGITILITIYAEVLPKMYVYTKPDRVALAFAPAFRPLVWILSPITHVVEVIARLSLKLVGIKIEQETQAQSSVEELMGAIELHGGSGRMEAVHERAMLRSILDLTQVEVEEIMCHRKKMFMIDSDMPPEELFDAVINSPYTRVPLWKDNPDNILGILHTKDLLRTVRSLKNDLSKLKAEELAKPAWFIPESASLLSQLHAFRRKREHFALVVDEYGSLQGLVTLEDILEEIVGEIVDEHDLEIPGVRISSEGTYTVDGTVTIRDLNRQFEWDLPDENAATVAGLILHESRKIPQVGQTFMFHGFRFDILRRHRQQITQVRIIPPKG